MSELSLLDTADMRIAEWYLVYHHRTAYYRLAHLLKPGFRHVELCRPIQYGSALTDVMWLEVYPNFEMLTVDVNFDPRPPWVRCPQATIQKVTAARRMPSVRTWWQFAMPSCVEVAKNALGINSFWLRTPWQLYKYIRARGGVIINKG